METITEPILGLTRRNQTSTPEEKLAFGRGLIRDASGRG